MVVMEEVGRGLSWILESLVECGAVSSLIFLTSKRKQSGSGCGWEHKSLIPG